MRSGFWYTYNDGTSSTQVPAPDSTGANPALPINVGCHGGTHCMETSSTQGYSSFAALGVSFNNRRGAFYDCAYDASAYQGISFWIKGSGSVRVQLRTVELTVASATTTGSCVSQSPSTLPNSQCFDDYGSTITLTQAWTQVQVPFSSLAQEDWAGTQIVAPFDRAKVQGMNFLVENGLPFDVVVDDVAFY
jgi:hypothetical protein